MLAQSATAANRGSYVAQSAFRPSDLPTVMRKAYDLASAHPLLA
jgi:hypothetical protein